MVKGKVLGKVYSRKRKRPETMDDHSILVPLVRKILVDENPLQGQFFRPKTYIKLRVLSKPAMQQQSANLTKVIAGGRGKNFKLLQAIEARRNAANAAKIKLERGKKALEKAIEKRRRVLIQLKSAEFSVYKATLNVLKAEGDRLEAESRK